MDFLTTSANYFNEKRTNELNKFAFTLHTCPPVPNLSYSLTSPRNVQDVCFKHYLFHTVFIIKTNKLDGYPKA